MRLAPKGENDIVKRTQDFGRRIVRLHNALPRNSGKRDLANQLLRSGTSIGAQVAEANFAKSDADFVSKLQGALQESEEVRHWIILVGDSGLVKPNLLEALLQESKEITAILVTLVAKTRSHGTSPG